MHLGCGYVAQAQAHAPGKVAQSVESDGGQDTPHSPVDVTQHEPGQPDLHKVEQGRGQAIVKVQEGRGEMQGGEEQRADNHSPEAPRRLEPGLDLAPVDYLLE